MARCFAPKREDANVDKVKEPKGFTIIEDSREQRPLDFSAFAPMGITCERRKLRTGDYTIAGFERQVIIERKSLNDVVGTLTKGRERFTREMYDRGAFYPAKLLVVEASWSQLSHPYDFSMANPASITNSLFALMMPPTGVQVFCSPSRAAIAWFIVNYCNMFIHRVTNGSAGMWSAIFAHDAADLAPFNDVPQDIGANLKGIPL